MDWKPWIAFCLTLPDSYEDYPFGEDWAVLRHRGNRKMFAAFYRRNGKLWSNLKCEPMEGDFLRSSMPGVFPAYHMNKTHWISVVLDGTAPEDEVKGLIRKSYRLTQGKF